MKRIIVSVTNDLVTDQRVHKVCTTLTDNGYQITLIGRKFKHSNPISREYKTKRMRLFFNKGFLFYAEFNIRIFFKILFLKKDILLANDLDTLLPNFLISKFQNKKLVYDSHELFTEVPELLDRPRVQKVWLLIEKNIIPNLTNCFTVCDSIAKYYSKRYSTPFLVVRNVPKKTQAIKKPFSTKIQSKNILLYQGALNKGRGIELMIETMRFLPSFQLVLIGNGDIRENLETLVFQNSVESNVLFLGRITPEKLKSLTPNATIGLSLEEDLGLNYRYALPNKIFDYIHAEVPCLVSNLPEMKRIILDNNFGEIVRSRDPKLLSEQIMDMCNNQSKYSNWKENLKTQKYIYNWEVESKKLINLYKK